MRAALLAACVALGAALSTKPAFADITIDSVLRTVYIVNIGTYTQQYGPDAGAYVDTVSATGGAGNLNSGQAIQNTNIQALTFSGSGSATLQANLAAVGGPRTETIFMVSFTITTPYAWVTTGTVSQTTNGGTGQAIARLTSDFDDILLANADVNLNTTNVDFSGSGILAPGSYYFEGLAYTDQGRGGNDPPHTANIVSSFDNISLTLTPVPEPVSLSLLAAGAGTLLLRRRTR
jgi:hypothetical protein